MSLETGDGMADTMMVAGQPMGYAQQPGVMAQGVPMAAPVQAVPVAQESKGFW